MAAISNKMTPFLPSGPTGLGSLSPLGHPGLAKKNANHENRLLTQAAVEAEAVFLGQLLEQMRRAMVEPLIKDQQGFKGYRTLADQQFARTLAVSGGLGLARRLLEDLAPREPHPKPESRHEGNSPEPDNVTPRTGDPPVSATP